MFRILTVLLIGIAATFGLVLIIRTRGKGIPRFTAGLIGSGPSRRANIEVIESRRVSQYADVCLVRCNGAEFFLLCGAAGVAVLDHKLGAASPAEDSVSDD